MSQAAASAADKKVDEAGVIPVDVLTKYKEAGQISQKVLAQVSEWCVEGANVVELCKKGDALLEEEVQKVFKGKKVNKGFSHPVTVSPSIFITPYTPLESDKEEAEVTLKKGEIVKIQLGAQIDGYPTIVCDSVQVSAGDEITGREADLFLATYYANELLLRLIVPPGLVGSEEEKAIRKFTPTQTEISQMLEKVAKSYDCNIVESTTSWLFAQNEIESDKKIILSPGSGVKGDGVPAIGEFWGVEVGATLGSGKIKNLPNRATLLRRTGANHSLGRDSSRAVLTEVTKQFNKFPFSLRQCSNEKVAKVGVLECIRTGIMRQYEVSGDKDDKPVARLLTTVAITKNGITKIAAPPTPDLSKYKTDKKITDEDILKILSIPLANPNKNKKKKKAATQEE